MARPPRPGPGRPSSRRIPCDHRHRPRTAGRVAHPAVRRHAARAARRPDRPGRPQRRRQDHHDAGARRRGRAVRGHASPRSGADRLPAAGPARGRPRRHRQGPGAVRARPRRDGRARWRRCRSQMAELVDGAQNERRRARVRPDRGAVLRARRVRRRERGRPDLRQPRPARPGAGPADAPRCPAVSAAASSWPGSCSPPRTAGGGAPSAHHAAARRADQPPRRRLDRLAARLPPGTTAAGSW